MTKPFSLWDWQKRDIETLSRHNYTGLLNIQPGGTKTAIATGAAVHSGSKVVLIIGPQGTFGTAWKPTVKALAGADLRRISNGKKAEREAMQDFILGYPGWYFVTPQLMTRSKDVKDWTGDMLIVDEAHMLNAAKSSGQRVLSGYHFNDGQPLAHRFKHRLSLSGTPARNHFERMWATMRTLWPWLDNRGQVGYHNYPVWLQDRMRSEDVVTGFEWVQVPREWFRPDGTIRKPDDVQHIKNIDGIMHYGKVSKAKKWLTEAQPGRLLSEAPCVIQHFRRDRCCDAHPNGFLNHPEPQVLTRVVPLLPAQKKIIADLEEQYLAWVDENPLVVDLTMVQKQRIRQVCLGVPAVETAFDEEGREKTRVWFENADRSPFADEVEQIIESVSPEPVVVYVESQSYAAALTRRLNRNGFPAFEYSGKTIGTRDADLALFGTKFQVVVITISAGGTGLDGLQRVSRTEIWPEEHVDETLNEQARARQDRIGAKGQVQRFILVDDLGYARDAMGTRLSKAIALRKSLRKAA